MMYNNQYDIYTINATFEEGDWAGDLNTGWYIDLKDDFKEDIELLATEYLSFIEEPDELQFVEKLLELPVVKHLFDDNNKYAKFSDSMVTFDDFDYYDTNTFYCDQSSRPLFYVCPVKPVVKHIS